ncbi:SRPBCC family protein [Nocardioides panacisoli]|uniref:SRPBCC family protein n=1 Tax=Nocardioides panacisoli TaxID=627624 RepID=A0ABP7HT18_9ACTN
MDLTHSFTVPTPIEETWAHFQDIAALAECFPGAQVTGSDGDTFEGTCKVKLGPIALVYAGSGTFVERDDEAHRFVVDAKGKDKRGNGTAGAKVTLTMVPTDTGTAVEVLTDLAITGKPAQFGRGVMQDVSDKLLGQFVACLEKRLGDEAAPAPSTADAADQDAEPASVPTGAAAVAAPAGDPDAGPASAPPPRAVPADDDALDLGSALLPVLVRTYGKQVVALVAGLIVLRWLVRRARS